MADQPATDVTDAGDTEHHTDLVPAPSHDVDRAPTVEIEPTSVETVDGEIVDEDVSGAPVDRPHREDRSLATRAYADRTIQRRPVVAPWLTNRGELAVVTRWAASHAGHHVAYHGVRLPQYGTQLTLRAPRGAWRAVCRTCAWLADQEGHPLRQHAVARNDSDTYLKLTRERKDRLRARLALAGVTILGLALAGVALVFLAPWWAQLLAGVGAVLALGIAGTSADKPVVSPAIIVYRAQRLTSEQVLRGLNALGIAPMTAKGASITFPAPIQRDGPGWRAEVDLPYGVVATDVMERKDRLASGLRRPMGCVWPEPVHEEHAGRLVLWVGDEDMAKAKPAPWPLLKGGRVDLFEQVPFMTDQRGRPVGIDLVFTNVLIGAMPRMGKTFTVRQLVLAAALDPYARLRIFELKGTGDLGMCERVAHRYASGAGEEALEACMDSLRELYADLENRAKTVTRIAKQRPADCPENKVTPALSRETKLGLGLEVLIIDECQELFSNKDYRDEAERLAEGLIKRGPAMGVILILATQRPDAKSLPKSISDNVGVRFCLRVMGQEPNDMVLGTSSYKNGIRASMFGAKDKGIGYLVGAFDDPLIGRTYYIDGPTADKVIDRARALREEAGTLTGHAVGEAHQVLNVAEDVLAVAGGAERLWSSVILERLAALRPDVYDGWAPEQLAASLRPFGGRPQQVWGTTPEGDGANRQGYLLAQLTRPGSP